MKNTIYLLSFFFLMGCSKDSIPRQQKPLTYYILTTMNLAQMQQKLMILKSQVSFRWSSSLYAQNYTLSITNLMTSATQNIQSTESSLSVTYLILNLILGM